MDYHEIEGKVQFQRFGIPTKVGFLLRADTDIQNIEYPCVVKAQVLSGKRGKAGGVKFAHNPEELRMHADYISKLVIGGNPVEAVLISPMLDIQREFYLGITLDSVNQQAVMIFTPFGGMDIEELAETSPEKLLRLTVTRGFDQSAFLDGVAGFSLEEAIVLQLCQIAERLTELFFTLDATTVEINPLIADGQGKLEAADSKLVIDDNALYRQADYVLIPRCKKESESVAVREAEAADLAYVELDENGNIGLMAGGAGIGMATVDTNKFYGGRPFNFLDLGGGVTAEKTYKAMKLLLENPKIERILINVFGGINNCEVMATGIVKAMKDYPASKTVVVKSRGHGQEEGWKLFEEAGCKQVRFGTTDDAVKLLLEEEGVS